MAGQRTTHNLRLIRQDYTYTVREVAEVLDTCEHTVLRWMSEGLKAIPETRPYLIYSKNLYDFLDARQAKRKHPCELYQMFCMKCRLPRGVAVCTLTTHPTKNRFIRLSGKCEACGTKMGRVVKPETWGEKHPLYGCMKPSVEQHNGVEVPQPKCSVEKGEQLCLGLTL